MLTVREAAARLRISQDTIRRWIKGGQLIGKMPGGTRIGYRIAESEVLRLLPRARDQAPSDSGGD